MLLVKRRTSVCTPIFHLLVHAGSHVELFCSLVVLQGDEVLTQLVVVLVQLPGAVIDHLK